MRDQIILKLNVLLFLFGLTGCNRYRVEGYYDEFRKTQACSLKNNLLKFKMSFFSGSRWLELNLDKVDDNTVMAYFSLLGINENTFFKPAAQLIFKVTHQDNSIEELRLASINPIQNKTGVEAVYGYMGITTYVDKPMSILSTQMTREQILKIAGAKKVAFALETISEPARGELGQEDLQPMREFVDQCLIKKKMIK